MVKGLRKHAEADIQAKAKAAFTRWKDNFKRDASPALPPQSEAENNNKKKIKTEEKEKAPAAPPAPQPVPLPPQEKEAAASGEEGKGYVSLGGGRAREAGSWKRSSRSISLAANHRGDPRHSTTQMLARASWTLLTSHPHTHSFPFFPLTGRPLKQPKARRLPRSLEMVSGGG